MLGQCVGVYCFFLPEWWESIRLHSQSVPSWSPIVMHFFLSVSTFQNTDPAFHSSYIFHEVLVVAVFPKHIPTDLSRLYLISNFWAILNNSWFSIPLTSDSPKLLGTMWPVSTLNLLMTNHYRSNQNKGKGRERQEDIIQITIWQSEWTIRNILFIE